MTLAAIETRAARDALAVFGAFHPTPDDNAPEGCGTVILLGPREPGFWAHVTAAPEFTDNAPDPLDRWSERVIGALAAEVGGHALFPFGGPPFLPFYAWALRSGRAWRSPVSLLVHDTAGLMLSFRGALTIPSRLPLPVPQGNSPCEGCTTQPCRAACPVGALTAAGYATDACHRELHERDRAGCMASGCAARRACPLSRSYGRLAEQSAFHMAQFHR